MNNVFVFVVCGSREHTDTLNYSIKHLKHFSKKEILVVTDLSRNEKAINHDQILDIKTPSELSNHQASIWLKTSLHIIVPQGPLYCYLDSDVIAVDHNCDNIFDSFITPITFGPDHCKIQNFSPNAINCGCNERHAFDNIAFEKAVSAVVKHRSYPPRNNDSIAREVNSFLEKIRLSPFKSIPVFLKIMWALVSGKTRLNKNISINLRNKEWIINSSKYPVLLAYRKEIKTKTGYRFLLKKGHWLKPDGNPLASKECNHLSDEIYRKFGVSITETNWQHWNGGVFLFNDSSFEFMNKWHTYTMQVFKDKYWKTRDQGSLIATVWNLGLQKHPLLNKKYNFIADFYNPSTSTLADKNRLSFFSDNEIIQPSLIHIYHEFGNENWEVWTKIKNTL